MDTTTSLTVMGDSIAAGLGDPVPGEPPEPWAPQLARRLGIEVPSGAYRNLGVPGLRLPEIRASQLDAATQAGADVTVVTGGGNDLLSRHFDLGVVEGELRAILGRLAATGTLVVTFGLLDVTCTELVPARLRAGVRRRIRAVNESTRQVTADHDGVFVDFFDHPAQSPALFSADGLHVNGRGHRIIAEEVVAALRSAGVSAGSAASAA